MTKITAYISLGGNMGQEEGLFSDALTQIASWPGIAVCNVSRLYRTEPQGDATQPWFTNQVAALLCSPEVTPAGLLDTLLALEGRLGRLRDAHRRYGPRCIDLDLLLYGDTISTDPKVTVPHPRMTERAFVLVPLLEIAPELSIPGGLSLAEYLARLMHTVDGGRIFQ